MPPAHNAPPRFTLLARLMRPGVLRPVIQSVFLLICLHTGWQFSRFVLWATDASATSVLRPPSVEAFLPIAALMGLRRLLTTGQWDMVHPAGLVILLAALLSALLLRKSFCGYICPVGLLSGLLNRLGQNLRLSLVPQRWVMRALALLKYALLAFFLFTVVLGMDANAVEDFIASPYNYVADARMLHFFQHPSRITLFILGILVVLGVALRSFWCRYLCPYGALLGLCGWFSPVHVHRDSEACIGCKRCTTVCPGCITVHAKKAVLTPECLGCTKCVAACPVEGCLNIRAGNTIIPAWLIGVGCAALMLGAWLLATWCGVWEQNVPLPMIRQFYQMFL